MNSFSHFTIPYAAIEQHGITGDRRTATLINNQGNIDWLCLPDYDGDIICGALLDHRRGGYLRFGPARRLQGEFVVDRVSAVNAIAWRTNDFKLELADLMAWPVTRQGSAPKSQAVLRRLRCLSGKAQCQLEWSAAANFENLRLAAIDAQQATTADHGRQLHLWSDHPLQIVGHRAQSQFELRAGEDAWAVLSCNDLEPWSSARAQQLFQESEDYWTSWVRELSYHGCRETEVRRSGLLIHLLAYAPTGSVVAAPTTSLPERIGGAWNADYRFAWVRDASLSLSGLTWLGNTKDCKHYLEWLCTLGSSTDAPLQPLYGIRGETELPPKKRDDLYGYRGSRPVRFNNHAYQQRQLDALGYLAECLHIYQVEGGEWEPEFWDLLEKAITYLEVNWQLPGNSIWELASQQHYVSGRILSWVAVDRAIQVANRLGKRAATERWPPLRERIRKELLTKGWSDYLGAYKQRYEGENLDAAALLMIVFDVLPAGDSRAVATVERIAERLTIDDFVYRFDPLESPGAGEQALGECEGAFLPCTFWLATAFAKLGRMDEAEAVLSKVERLAAIPGMFAEAADPRTGNFLGNTPLLFSQVEYIRTVLELGNRDEDGRM